VPWPVEQSDRGQGEGSFKGCIDLEGARLQREPTYLEGVCGLGGSLWAQRESVGS
jgi:hypothetical protein